MSCLLALYDHQTFPREGLQLLQISQHWKLTSATISLVCFLPWISPIPSLWQNPMFSQSSFSLSCLQFHIVALRSYPKVRISFPGPVSSGPRLPFWFYLMFPSSSVSSHPSHLASALPCQALSYLSIFAMLFPLLGSSPHPSYIARFLLPTHLSWNDTCWKRSSLTTPLKTHATLS